MSIRVELRRDAGRVGPTTGPWIRRRQIARIRGIPDPHDLAEVVDRRGDTIGWGLISPASDITVRLLTFGGQRPPSQWLSSRIDAAIAARSAYGFERADTSGYRLINSEGDGLPGLVVDRYERDLVVVLGTAPMAAREHEILTKLRAHADGAIYTTIARGAAERERLFHELATAPGGTDEGEPSDGYTPESLSFREYGLSFVVDAPPAQKTGAYFDQRPNRRIMARLAARSGHPLLDLGCHVGGFALHCRRLGVAVVALDQSGRALELARANATRNGLDGIEWVQGDMFRSLEDPRLEGPFGAIVIDPPKIASAKSDAERASRALERIVERFAGRVVPNGHVALCTCSHHLGRDRLDQIMATISAATATTWSRVLALGPGADHPVAPGHREGDYLRVNVYQRRMG